MFLHNSSSWVNCIWHDEFQLRDVAQTYYSGQAGGWLDKMKIKNDWIEPVESDLEFLDISLFYADILIQSKNFVDKQTEQKVLEHLNYPKL